MRKKMEKRKKDKRRKRGLQLKIGRRKNHQGCPQSLQRKR